MLQSLNIINFAIIDDTLLEFEEGVVIFTGETGAGKSIIFDALAVLLGRRASVNMIRSGAEFFRVEGIFSMTEKLEEVLKSLDIDIDENQLIISRKMNTKGRGTCMINGSLCTLKQIQSIGNELLILHEQNDNEMLLSANSCQIMIDESSKEIRDLYKNYRKEYTSWYNLRKQLLEFETKKQEHERRLDILQWEINRIKEAEIKKEEDEYIDKQIKILSNQEKIREKIVDSISLIHAENGVIELLSKVLRNLNSISMYDQELNEVIESIQSAYYTIDDRGSFLESYQNTIEYSEKDLNELQLRDELLNDLKHKYGPTLDDVIDYLRTKENEYAELHDMIFKSDSLKEKLNTLTSQLKDKIKNINEIRLLYGDKLCNQLTSILRQMGMPNATIKLCLIPSKEPTVTGVDEMELYFSANEGEPLLPMRKIASGGEISRIALAVEVITAPLFKTRTLVFDEIDTGISGEAALQVAKQISKLGESVQVLCITHLPQTASIGDQYYHIQKEVKNGRTYTLPTQRTHKEHLMDVAHLISGKEITETSLASAIELEQLLKNNK